MSTLRTRQSSIKLRTWRCSPSCTSLLCCLTSKSVTQPGWSTWVMNESLNESTTIICVYNCTELIHLSHYRPIQGCSVSLSTPTRGCQYMIPLWSKPTEERRGLKLLLTSSPSLTMHTSTCFQVLELVFHIYSTKQLDIIKYYTYNFFLCEFHPTDRENQSVLIT